MRDMHALDALQPTATTVVRGPVVVITPTGIDWPLHPMRFKPLLHILPNRKGTPSARTKSVRIRRGGLLASGFRINDARLSVGKGTRLIDSETMHRVFLLHSLSLLCAAVKLDPPSKSPCSILYIITCECHVATTR